MEAGLEAVGVETGRQLGVCCNSAGGGGSVGEPHGVTGLAWERGESQEIV